MTISPRSGTLQLARRRGEPCFWSSTERELHALVFIDPNPKIVLCSRQLPYVPLDLTVGAESVVLGTADVEIRSVATVQRPLVSAALERYRAPRPLSLASLGHTAGAFISEGAKVLRHLLPGRHAKPHVTKERYIKAFDPAVLAAMKSLETTLDALNDCSATVQLVN